MNAIDDLQAIAEGRDIRSPYEIAAIDIALERLVAVIERGWARRDTPVKTRREMQVRLRAGFGEKVAKARQMLLSEPKRSVASIAAEIGCAPATVYYTRDRMRKAGTA